MRLLLILILACGAFAQRTLPPEDQPKQRLHKPESRSEKVKRDKPNAKFNPNRSGPERLVFDLEEPPNAIPDTPPPPGVTQGPVSNHLAILGKHVTYKDYLDGQWKPTEPGLFTTDRGWLMTGGPVDMVVYHSSQNPNTSFIGQHYSDPERQDEYFWVRHTFPRLTYAEESRFTYQHNQIDWTVTFNEDGHGFSFESQPIKSRASRSFSFAYFSSHPFQVDAGGNVVNTDGPFYLSRAVMVGANGVRYPCNAWTATGSSMSFTCDDAALPAAALPYVIDPTANVGGGGYDLHDSAYNPSTEYAFLSYNTGSLGATNVSSATLEGDVYIVDFAYDDGEYKCSLGGGWGQSETWYLLPPAFTGAQTPYYSYGWQHISVLSDATAQVNKTGTSWLTLYFICGYGDYGKYSGRSATYSTRMVVTYTVNNPPTLGGTTGILADTHYGAWHNITATVSDPQGHATLSHWHLLINYGVDGGWACFTLFYNRFNTMHLLNDVATDWGPGPTMGTANVLGNSQCQIDIANSSYSYPNSTTVTANLRIRFMPNALTRNPTNTYLYAADLDGAAVGWVGPYQTGNVRTRSKLIVTR